MIVSKSCFRSGNGGRVLEPLWAWSNSCILVLSQLGPLWQWYLRTAVGPAVIALVHKSCSRPRVASKHHCHAKAYKWLWRLGAEVGSGVQWEWKGEVPRLSGEGEGDPSVSLASCKSYWPQLEILYLLKTRKTKIMLHFMQQFAMILSGLGNRPYAQGLDQVILFWSGSSSLRNSKPLVLCGEPSPEFTVLGSPYFTMPNCLGLH